MTERTPQMIGSVEVYESGKTTVNTSYEGKLGNEELGLSEDAKLTHEDYPEAGRTVTVVTKVKPKKSSFKPNLDWLF